MSSVGVQTKTMSELMRNVDFTPRRWAEVGDEEDFFGPDVDFEAEDQLPEDEPSVDELQDVEMDDRSPPAKEDVRGSTGAQNV